MSLFAKCIALLCVGLIAAAAMLSSTDDAKPSKSGKDSSAKESKDAEPEATPKKHHFNVPVVKDHPSKHLSIPYFSSDGKRQMNFKIAVATRVDETHLNLENMQIESFDENEAHEFDIDLPNSVLDTDTSVITTRHHVMIKRDDFELSADAMIFNTRTQQGGVAGNVRMIIYDLESETPKPASSPDSSGARSVQK